MQHEKIFKREDGAVKVYAILDYEHKMIPYNQTWKHLTFSTANVKSEYWNIHFGDERDPATPAEILEAKLELWNKIKPE